MDILAKYVQSGDVAGVENSLECKIYDPVWFRKPTNKIGDTVLHIAAREGHRRILQTFGKYGGDFEVANLDGKRPLHEAVLGEHLDCVKFLIHHGAVIDTLKRADWEGHRDILLYLLDRDNRLWDTVSNNGRTPLHTAALHGKLEATELLVAMGKYNIDSPDSCGSTPFMDAIRGGHVATADWLLSNQNVNLHKTDSMGREAVHLAAQAGAVNSMQYLIGLCPELVNQPTSTGLTNLHCAAKENQVEIIQYLIQLQCDVNIQDHKGHTALHMAAGGQHMNSVEILLQHGAVDTPNLQGTLARDLARTNTLTQLFDKWAS
ncbi:unnamed protein product [Owenia fusiformis]|uniref:Uncharacterized protein n=1 Tax=Owenia fusiformis TaxID=6347 RepID=A0A8S4NLV7_OWEFU|nr:unnamed protein product [Owenia fusiformis]